MSKMTSKQSKAPAFEDREIDASIDLCCWLVLCPFTVGAIPYKTTIRLDAEGKASKNRGVYCGCQSIFLARQLVILTMNATLRFYTHARAEVTKIDVNLCGKSESKRPYGELGSVQQSTCCCCVSMTSSFGEISPGCGCQHSKVEELVEELKARQRTRGDTAQIQRTEQTLERLDQMETKLDLIMQHLNISQPVEAQTMGR